MANLYKIPFLLLVATLIVSAIAVDHYAHHGMEIRMRKFKELIKGIEDDRSDPDIVNCFWDEICRHPPYGYCPPDRKKPEPSRSFGESVIALLKMFTVIDNRFPSIDEIPVSSEYIYVESLKDILIDPTIDLDQEIQNNQALAQHILDWNTYVDLLDSLSTKYNLLQGDFEWVCYALMVVIENSPHLKHSFTNGMMLKLNTVRHSANVININYFRNHLQLDDLVLNDIIEFPFDNIMIQQNLSKNPVSELQTKRFTIRDEFVSLIVLHNNQNGTRMEEKAAISFFVALLELSDIELLDQLNEVTIALGWFHKVIRSNIVSRLGDMLQKRCEAQILLDSELPRRLNAVKDLPQSFTEVMNQPQTLDFDTMERYKILLKVTDENYENHENYEKILKVYHQLADMLSDPNVLNDPKRLAEFDKYHTNLYDSNESAFFIRRDWINDDHLIENLKNNSIRAEELLKSIDLDHSKNSVDIRNQIRVLLRMIFRTSNFLRYTYDEEFDNFDLNTHTVNAVKTYTQFIKYETDISPPLIKEWYWFTLLFPKVVSKAFDDETINEIANYNNNRQESNPTDVVLYAFLGSISRILAATNRSSNANQLIPVILELEERIGYADFAPISVYALNMKEKQYFYIFYAVEALEYQKNLTRLVEHHIELLTYIRNWLDLKYPFDNEIGLKDFARRQILDAIYTATSNDPNAANHLIDPTGQLRLKVNKLMNGFIGDYGMDDVFEEKISQCETIYGPIVV